MHPVLGTCPVCGDVLSITRLHCRACDTSIEGNFYASGLAQLTPEQLRFVETFLQCKGRIKAVEEKLGISYPTVRSRLQDVLTAMGYEMTPDEEDELIAAGETRRRVLVDLEEGRISTDEAITKLRGDS